MNYIHILDTFFTSLNLDPGTLILYSTYILLLGAVLSILFKGVVGARISLGLSLVSSFFMILVSLYVLLHGVPIETAIHIPFVGSTQPIDVSRISISIDSLSAFFVLLLSIVVFASSLYGLNYVERFAGREHLGWYGFNYSLFVLSMYMTLAVNDLLWFVVFWELMTLFSQFLVSYEKEKKVAVSAGFKYFCITKFGAELMFLSALIIVALLAQSTSFEAVEHTLRELQLSSSTMYFVLLSLFIIGLLVKCAAVPFHSWLPEAHPEAPANVSALLSGAMIKIPIYMMARLLIQFTMPNAVWGLVVSTIGCITLAVGTLYALVQKDSKRLLAYHSVGQIGYILLALGASIYLYSLGANVFASIALAAALYHALNHACFKSLLFLVAGSVEYRVGTRDLDVLGGLGKYMRITAICCAVASFSIAGIPPFNGFVSKWMIYVSTIPTSTILSLYGAIAMFISAVTTASFVKFYTKIFAGTPRIRIDYVKEIPIAMKISQIVLASACILLGILPGAALSIMQSVATDLGMAIQSVSYGIGYVVVPDVASTNTLMIAVALSIFTPLVLAILRPVPSVEPWFSGNPAAPRFSIRARDFYQVFEEVFSETYSVGRALSMVFYVRLPQSLKGSLRVLALSFEDPITSLPIAVLIALIVVLSLWVIP